MKRVSNRYTGREKEREREIKIVPNEILKKKKIQFLPYC